MHATGAILHHFLLSECLALSRNHIAAGFRIFDGSTECCGVCLVWKMPFVQ